jgi:hypothetical protein
VTRALQSSDYATAALLALLLFVVYNSNGREIPSYDSQPTKYAARELLLRGTLSLNYVVGGTPQFIERAGFQLANDGRYRAAYSPVPSVTAAIIIWPFSTAGLIDIREPRAPNLIAALAASMMVALAMALTFLTARRQLSPGRATALTAALGLGTGLWSTASQTLWQHETAILGLTTAVFGLCALRRTGGEPAGDSAWRTVALGLLIGLGLGLATGSRQQLAPSVVVLTAAAIGLGGWRCGVAAVGTAAAVLVPVWLANLQWFGSVLGAAPMLEALHNSVHATTGTFSLSSGGFLGLMVSPNRGLLIFSPVVALVVIGLPGILRSARSSPVLWCTVAAALQFVLYASYVVWWGGHTYGPRYMLDVLPLLVPMAIVAMGRIQGRRLSLLATASLTWSIGIAALGAFVHPHERWNTLPADVDRHHERLWDWSDMQIRRCLTAGLSPQNYSLVPVIADEDR